MGSPHSQLSLCDQQRCPRTPGFPQDVHTPVGLVPGCAETGKLTWTLGRTEMMETQTQRVRLRLMKTLPSEQAPG